MDFTSLFHPDALRAGVAAALEIDAADPQLEAPLRMLAHYGQGAAWMLGHSRYAIGDPRDYFPSYRTGPLDAMAATDLLWPHSIATNIRTLLTYEQAFKDRLPSGGYWEACSAADVMAAVGVEETNHRIAMLNGFRECRMTGSSEPPRYVSQDLEYLAMLSIVQYLEENGRPEVLAGHTRLLRDAQNIRLAENARLLTPLHTLSVERGLA